MPTWGVSLIDSRVAVGHKSEVIVQLFDGKKLYLYPHTRSDCDRWVDLLQRASRRKIGNYYGVTGLVGMGSFAEVRIGYDKSTGQQVAIKVMKKNKRDTELMRSVECEMNFISKNIDHDNIVATYDVFDTRDNLFIVMEYMPGGMLYDILANEGFFNEKNASNVMRDLLYAVECLHDNDIVHRDIKPENVLALNKTWPLKVKLADFGLADFVLENSFGEKSTCGMYGTPFFVAPEVIKAETYTPAVDIWSLGVLAYNMLSGKLPFDGNNIKEVLRRVRGGRYSFPDNEWTDISMDAKDFIRGLLEVDPKKRLTAREALCHCWITSANISERAINNDRSALGYEQRKLRMSSMAIDDVAGLLRLDDEAEEGNAADEHGGSNHSHGHNGMDHGIRALSRLFPGKSGKSSRSSGSARSRHTGDYESMAPRHDANAGDIEIPGVATSREQQQTSPRSNNNRSQRRPHGQQTTKRPGGSPGNVQQQSRPRSPSGTQQGSENNKDDKVHAQHEQGQGQTYGMMNEQDQKELDNSTAVSNAAPLRLTRTKEEEGATSLVEGNSGSHPYNAPSDLPGWNDAVASSVSMAAVAAAAAGAGMGKKRNKRGGQEMEKKNIGHLVDVGVQEEQEEQQENEVGGGKMDMEDLDLGYRGGLQYNEQFVGGNTANGFALPAILSVKDIMRRRHEAMHGTQSNDMGNAARRRRGGGNNGGNAHAHGHGHGHGHGEESSDSEKE